MYLPLPTIALFTYYQYVHLNTPPADCCKFITFKDESLKAKWAKRKIPMHMFVTWFLEDKVAFKVTLALTLALTPTLTLTLTS